MPYKNYADRLESSNRYRKLHKEQHNTGNKKYRAAHPQYHFKYDLKLHYGISPEDYNHLFELQGGCCAICGIPQLELDKRLHVDHNHISGEIRGLLCTNCNVALGQLKTDTLGDSLLIKAIDYINGH
jgi:hypothetical protein